MALNEVRLKNILSITPLITSLKRKKPRKRICYAVYEIGKNTILTIMEGEETLSGPEYELIINNQFLIAINELS